MPEKACCRVSYSFAWIALGLNLRYGQSELRTQSRNSDCEMA